MPLPACLLPPLLAVSALAQTSPQPAEKPAASRIMEITRKLERVAAPSQHRPYRLALTILGQKSGQICSTAPAWSMQHSVVSPRDIQSGLPTGQRQHKPLVVTREIDRSSPMLANALCTNENLKQVDLVFSTGQPRETYRIRLTNAAIASIETLASPDGSFQEQIAFTYQKIEWTWEDGGITAMDDWEARN